MSQIKFLRFIGITEGISYLVLLLIAMPLKHFMDMPLAVTIVGWMHGVLFMAYVLAVFIAILPMRWSILNVLIALAASLVPAGTFFLDPSLKRRLNELRFPTSIA